MGVAGPSPLARGRAAVHAKVRELLAGCPGRLSPADATIVAALALGGGDAPPAGRRLETLTDDWFLELLFDPQGKYGAYGKVDDRKVVSSKLTPLSIPAGGTSSYRYIDLTFSPPPYNQNTVERRALLAATAAASPALPTKHPGAATHP